jgi:hypothetical protein
MCNDFDSKNKTAWSNNISTLFGTVPPLSACWEQLDDFCQVLNLFMGPNLNHTLLPHSGGLDMEVINMSHEPRCIELRPGSGIAYVSRPDKLYFEHFPDSSWNSFFLLELAPLQPCGVYEPEPNEAMSEEVLELTPFNYVERHHLDEGHLGYNENGDEIPLPETKKVVVRCFEGKILIVAKRSYWNLDTSTYDGRHNRMTNRQIRDVIQQMINVKQ